LRFLGFRSRILFRHRDLDLGCDAEYHVLTFLEKELGIYIDSFEYRYQDIKDLVQNCLRSNDLEPGRSKNLLSPSTPSPKIGGKDSAAFSGTSTLRSSSSQNQSRPKYQLDSESPTASLLTPMTSRLNRYSHSDEMFSTSERYSEEHEMRPVSGESPCPIRDLFESEAGTSERIGTMK
jgi:hypothetical protein